MRLERAIEGFLAYGRLQQDWSPETERHYGATLYAIADRHPEAMVADFEGRAGHDMIVADIGVLWGDTAASTRANRISILHSFFDWLETSYLLEVNHVRRIKRPPKRRPKIDRPTPAELQLVVQAASIVDFERAPIVAMRGAGLRRSSVLASRWRDWDLTNGFVKAWVKGGNWIEVPLDPDVLDEMREIYRVLQPDPDDYLYPAQRVKFDRPGHSVRTVPDATRPSSPQALWNMLRRVSKRAIGRELHPHQLRHGFANALDQDGVDLRTAQFLMGHANAETTENYMDERKLRDAQQRLHEAAHKRRQRRHQPSGQPSTGRERPESGWRESNPRSASDIEPSWLEGNEQAFAASESDTDGGHNVPGRDND